jgi:hypothetical protein
MMADMRPSVLFNLGRATHERSGWHVEAVGRSQTGVAVISKSAKSRYTPCMENTSPWQASQGHPRLQGIPESGTPLN